jgi:hypothetical protein
MKSNEVSMQEAIFPASGEPVVQLTQISDDEKTLIGQPRAHFAPAYTAPMYALPEEALSFTVDESSIHQWLRRALQPRGLLRLNDSFTVGNVFQGTHREIEQNHLDLLFTLKDDFGHRRNGNWIYSLNPNAGFRLTT